MADPMAAAMQQYTASMQAQFAAVMDKVRSSMEQSSGMAGMMNDMLENLLLQSLRVACVVASSPSMAVDVRATNLGTIPIPVVAIAIALRPHERPDADYELLTRSVPQDLAVHDAINVLVPLALPSLGQFDGRIAVSCVSPGTGKRLETSHEFSIYYLQQLSIEHSTSTAIPDAPATTVRGLDLAKLRGLLRLSPRDALATHGGYLLLGPDQAPWFVLRLLDGDSTHADVGVVASSSSPIDVGTIAHELTLLAGPRRVDQLRS
ncbi:hypothetical protein SPRG_07177 [Saprolegnia parasitica CBS 223.65]|uniref:Uncharacterized protein n=1 Tax=Saprolegnia parasitica (strain CBS 223.65) TaxID=695850 RepID=A0A067CAV8_SAPPC|nr:hypothetical protein SPRG_07177 [Saprolegnia parasitica CBS 223.65]KDO27904.1 hypothetical protein SPRG_07177 [Saprolegnia parasitica CBS 223.65]|eukprot:XP_012201361.1 hypothetical protein SPRG_07177 [Saprolegnia parasitica CBS 223.65]